LSGKAKNYTRKGISGKDLTYNMCDNCGSLVFVEAESVPESKIVKLGTIDDDEILNTLGYPTVEIFTKDRLAWLQVLPGAAQKEVA
jgi:hypothetical protein